MPIPIILGVAAAVAGTTGAGAAIRGGFKMKKAKSTLEEAKNIQERSLDLFEKKNDQAVTFMDDLGKQELSILQSFSEFSDLIEKIQERPDFATYQGTSVELPKFEAEQLRSVSVAAGVLLGGLGGAAAGTAGGFAAAGATTSAIIALGTASTGTAISTLSGAAAVNATLAVLGGGTVAAGGGGIALGSMILSGATFGVGILVGGILFNVTGNKMSKKANVAYDQAMETKKEVEKINGYFDELLYAAGSFKKALTRVEGAYRERLATLGHIINFSEKTNWNDFTDKEKRLTQNTVLLVGLLYHMCKVQLVLASEEAGGVNKVNRKEVQDAVDKANTILNNMVSE